MNGVAIETEKTTGILERRSAVDVANGTRWTTDSKTDRLTTYPPGDRTSLLRAHGAAKSVEVPPASPRIRRAPRESRRVSLAQAAGYVQLNQYRLLEPIGQGSYGIVKLAYNEEDDTHYAMKILSKRKLMRRAGLFGRAPPRNKGPGPPPDPLQRVYREIAVLKKLDHPNVVKLVEVLDDPAEDQLYLVFQLLEGGPVIDIPTENPLSEEVARRYFRDVLLGVEYLHYQGIAHRDIKPANLLLGEGRVQVADLGACGELAGRLSGAVGTPAFRAPEATASTDNYGGEAADIWSLGVTLFAMVTGRVPWTGGSASELQRRVLAEPLVYPRGAPSRPLRALLAAMLEKQPARRVTLQEIKVHEWVTAGGSEPLPSEQENCRLVEVTEEDMAQVVTSIPNLSTLILIKTMLKKHSFQNPFLRSREGSSARRDSASPREPDDHKARRGGLLARAGRSLSAPGNYMTERQASFDVNLESVQEGRDQSQDIPSTSVEENAADSHNVSSPSVSSQSVSSQSISSQSVSSQSVSCHSVASQSVSSQSVASQSVSCHSVASQSVSSQSVASQSVSCHSVASQSTENKSANSSKCVSRSHSVSDQSVTTSPSISDVQSLDSSQNSVSLKGDSPSENGRKGVNANSHCFRITRNDSIVTNKIANSTENAENKVSITKQTKTDSISTQNPNNVSQTKKIVSQSSSQSVSSQGVSKQSVSKQGVSKPRKSIQDVGER